MSKIFAVMSTHGMYEDRFVTLEKCFADMQKAEAYMVELQDTDKQARYMAGKCEECGGNNKSCPFWLDPLYIGDGCGNLENHAWYEPMNYYIKEVEFDEAWSKNAGI